MHRGVKKRVKAVKNVKTVLLILVSLFGSLFLGVGKHMSSLNVFGTA